MVSFIVKAALLLYFLHLVANVTGQSSCIPGYFRYIQQKKSDEFSGRIEIQQPPKGATLDLSATLSIAVELPTSYVGRMELAQSREESVEAVQQGRPLKYNIYFPLRRPIPKLTSLSINNQTVCTGPRATGNIVTSIILSHTLHLPGIEQLSEEKVHLLPPQRILEHVPLPPVATPPPVLPTVEPVIPATIPENLPILSYNPGFQQCGRSIVAKQNVGHLIVGGEKTVPGQWPWLVAIYKEQTALDREFQCGGTLLTNTRVLTAAHCVPRRDRHSVTSTLWVSVGRYSLHDKKETWAEDRTVIEYRIHPDYQKSNSKPQANADADLAVLILQKRVEFNKMIQPICLWSGSASLKHVVRKTGVVVGWGRDELGKLLEEPLQIASSIVSQAVCLRSHDGFRLTTSNRTFCAGENDGKGPCKGDSGSGFVIYNKDTDRYYLRGVVSLSIWDQSEQSCDLQNYVIYVDAAKHLKWIQEQMYT